MALLVHNSVQRTEDLLSTNAIEVLKTTLGESKLGEGLTQLLDRQSGRGTVGVVFYSDGINTSGPSLAEAEREARAAGIPIYSVLVGSAKTPPDLQLVDLLLDQEVYYGDQVTVEVSAIASEITKANVKVSLIDQSNNTLLDQTELQLGRDNNQGLARLRFVPRRAGTIPLVVKASVVAGEVDTANNELTASVNVQDKSLRVLLVQEQPDYEFRFLKHFLERSKQVGDTTSASFELQCVLQFSRCRVRQTGFICDSPRP